jgi:hypothetical protein
MPGILATLPREGAAGLERARAAAVGRAWVMLLDRADPAAAVAGRPRLGTDSPDAVASHFVADAFVL